uniref:Sigma54_CBD domain-containing protein n=1 Tax=Caenorhabditis japonica TaxID=281687 RepID=A0A8R1IVE5_CAEJA
MSGQDLTRYLLDAAEENPVLELEEQAGPLARIPRRLDQRRYDSYDPLLQVRGAESTLEQLLIAQIRVMTIPEELENTAVYLAGCVNDDGYLTVELAEVQAALEQPMSKIAAGLELLQSLDPAGVGARNLQECLLLQIRRDSSAALYAERMVEAGLEALVPFHPGRTGSRLGMTSREAQVAYDYITRLDPKPCRSIGCTERPHYIIPDAIVGLRNGEAHFSLHVSGNPRVSMNEACIRWIREAAPDEIWAHRAAEARAIIRSVHLRRRTLVRVLGGRDGRAKGLFGQRPIRVKTA